MIEVRALDKAIKGRTILSNISFEIKSGECVALIGPNGAGKTTLLSCLLGDRKATKGQVLLDGLAPQAQSNKEKVAVLPQENAIPTDLKVKELLRFFQAIYKDSLTDVEIDSLLCFSPEQKNQLAGKLSGGQKRLLAFVICLIGKPKLLFLDEPTAGMDTSTRQRFWEIVHDLKEKGVTIFYTSHYIEEVEHTAERILVLHQGRLLRDTTPFAMRSEEQEKEVTLPIAFAVVVEDLDAIDNISYKQDTVSFKTRAIEQVWANLQEAGCRISDLEVQNKTLLNSLFDKTREKE
ncbi:TPA: ABC transporter ATP-binding protein [Streptococcus suis]|jgi:ABC-2 type transport system ATP-binding protein|uniref:ABC transporter ATP-binding protein n=1 Tax=Streptococcus parasuis TaxID=1501662 RepID=UPI001EF9B5F9|nr:ABC transporter ATP-binding protein [Streptococcus parasuis]MDG4498339.1 ABC transporter ATP-binding protein [Streptococcus suis]NCB78503.1 ABC transporter ATP-binding protein [Bacilli bacterium]MDG4524205.1 ABC transporter ATP-binding protein [Streptococcus suis]ULL20608.1 ABC transporter ATP-binding protein [Streptococcus suis]WFB92464.1 ABC transporter ATP-binding protein [Streptococcus parasuis]